MQTLYTPKNLKRWTLPQCYIGAEWADYFRSGVGQSRDSNALERANFDAMLGALKKIPEPSDWPHDFTPFQVVRENHWAVGWVEWIAIHETATDALKRADEIMASFDDYPVIDEQLFSQYEQTEADETWRNCYRPLERVEYIREHRSQFEFRDFQDLIGCVRGKYFAGYAGEFLS